MNRIISKRKYAKEVFHSHLVIASSQLGYEPKNKLMVKRMRAEGNGEWSGSDKLCKYNGACPRSLSIPKNFQTSAHLFPAPKTQGIRNLL